MQSQIQKLIISSSVSVERIEQPLFSEQGSKKYWLAGKWVVIISEDTRCKETIQCSEDKHCMKLEIWDLILPL